MFKKAIPVFASGKENEKNYHLVLKASTESLADTVLYITAYSFYRLSVNGELASFGPARTAEGYARVDKIELGKYDSHNSANEIVIEAVGYNCRSLSTVCQSSFVVAELRRGGEVVLATGRDFKGYRSARMHQKVERYSCQRHFGEIHSYTWGGICAEEVELTAAQNTPKYLPRHVPMPLYDKAEAALCRYIGEFAFDQTLTYRPTRSSFEITEYWGRYPEDEIEHKPFRWIQRQKLSRRGEDAQFPIELKAGEYAVIDMQKIEVGFVGADISAKEDSDIVIGFSEMCFSNDFEFTNINCQNVLECLLDRGIEASAESHEPYTCRFAIVLCKAGSITLNGFYVRRFEYPTKDIIKREIKDSKLAEIYSAAVRTFAHNAVDIYTDCPSRERAGWLCDSYFTGRAEYFLTGKTLVEDAFLENYRLFDKSPDLPCGVLPMCYPSDVHVSDQTFIPQWNMWYVLEAEEYLTKRNTAVDRELFRRSIYGILDFLKQYENSDGLLQNIPGWNFVEWSTANQWVQDVNYPTNFLYAQVLRAAARLYGDDPLNQKASRIAKRTEELSFDGEVFIDNAVSDVKGKLVNTRNSSEAGQYYAILFGELDLSDEKYSRLCKNVLEGFSDFYTEGRGYVAVNAFIGFYLRICTLMKLGEYELLEKDIKSFFGKMSDATETLWEYKDCIGSYDHGFASFAAIAIDEIQKNQKKKNI